MSKKEFPIEPMTPVIVRDEFSWWTPVFFKGMSDKERFPFLVYGCGNFGMLSPLAGNESAIGTKNDVFELWDKERLEKEGMI